MKPLRSTWINTQIGIRIRDFRTAAALSRIELAQRIDTTEQTLADYELGLVRCPASNLFEISQALGVPILAFFSGLDAPDPSSK